MGAFDIIRGECACPACGAGHSVDGVQTKFFRPDPWELRELAVGRTHAIDFHPAALAHETMWEGQWWRVRDLRDQDRMALLCDPYDLINCECECECGVALAFVVDVAFTRGEPSTATVIGLRALDARAPETAAQIDFADGELAVEWVPPANAWLARVEAVAALDEAARVAWLHERLLDRFSSAD